MEIDLKQEIIKEDGQQFIWGGQDIVKPNGELVIGLGGTPLTLGRAIAKALCNSTNNDKDVPGEKLKSYVVLWQQKIQGRDVAKLTSKESVTISERCDSFYERFPLIAVQIEDMLKVNKKD